MKTTTKICTICKKDKLFIEFNKNAGKKDGLQTHCKDCSKEKFQKYYHSNREKHSQETQKRKKEHRKEVLQFVYDYLRTHPCVDCGHTDPRCLEFDHVRGVKSMNISHMVRNNLSIPRVEEEIEKCDVRCANCHRIKTSIDQNWYRAINTDL